MSLTAARAVTRGSRSRDEAAVRRRRGGSGICERATLTKREWGTHKSVAVSRERQQDDEGRVARRADAEKIAATTAPTSAPKEDCVCSFGATRVGALIGRVRLHVTTDRFLAARRGDRLWEAACDYAALALTRLESRMRPAALDDWICTRGGAGLAPAAGYGDDLHPAKTTAAAARGARACASAPVGHAVRGACVPAPAGRSVRRAASGERRSTTRRAEIVRAGKSVRRAVSGGCR